nr:hypothetical protein [Candidatus Sigynarchaeota archaeon]
MDAKTAGDINWRTVEEAKACLSRGDFRRALELFETSRSICIEQGWHDGVHYADDMILAIYPQVKAVLDEMQPAVIPEVRFPVNEPRNGNDRVAEELEEKSAHSHEVFGFVDDDKSKKWGDDEEPTSLGGKYFDDTDEELPSKRKLNRMTRNEEKPGD